MTSKIEWTDETWNPLRGCTPVSEGCRNCYAEAMAGRFNKPGQWGHGIAETRNGKRRWTGKTVFDAAALSRPLRWRKPRRVFVTSIGDPFHSTVTDEQRDAIIAVMAMTPQHTYQLLTKRPEAMREYLTRLTKRRENVAYWACLAECGDEMQSQIINTLDGPHIPNLWIGTSVENQAAADARIPPLLDTPAALRFLSCEPLLGPVCVPPGIDWVIAGGESGPQARPADPDWFRSLRDQCAATKTPFLFKQWGEWAPRENWPIGIQIRRQFNGTSIRIGRKKAGRLLDGQTHDEMPGEH